MSPDFTFWSENCVCGTSVKFLREINISCLPPEQYLFYFGKRVCDRLLNGLLNALKYRYFTCS